MLLNIPSIHPWNSVLSEDKDKMIQTLLVEYWDRSSNGSVFAHVSDIPWSNRPSLNIRQPEWEFACGHRPAYIEGAKGMRVAAILRNNDFYYDHPLNFDWAHNGSQYDIMMFKFSDEKPRTDIDMRVDMYNWMKRNMELQVFQWGASWGLHNRNSDEPAPDSIDEMDDFILRQLHKEITNDRENQSSLEENNREPHGNNRTLRPNWLFYPD